MEDTTAGSMYSRHKDLKCTKKTRLNETDRRALRIILKKKRVSKLLLKLGVR